MSQPPPPGWAPPPGGWPPHGWVPPPPRYSVGNALRWSWDAFRANSTTLVVGTLLVGLLGLLLITPGFAIAGVASDWNTILPEDGVPEIGDYLTFYAILMAWTFAASIPLSLLNAGLVRAVLRITDGERPTIGSLFTVKDGWRVMALAVMTTLLTAVGYVACVLPGLAVAVVAPVAVYVLLDQGVGPVESFRRAFAVFRGHLGEMLLAWLVFAALAIGGAMACYVGLLVAMPVGMLLNVSTYRYVTGGTIAAVDRQ